MKKKVLVSLVATSLAIGGVVGGTMAYLTDTTQDKVNTFTVGNVYIALDETTGESYKMVPAGEDNKDPKVTVKAGSEACWVFVKVTETENIEGYDFDDYITYSEANGWTKLDGNENVWYREQPATTSDVTYNVLNNNKVYYSKDITNAMMELAKTSPLSLTFKAYAIQKDGFTTAAAAWAEVGK